DLNLPPLSKDWTLVRLDIAKQLKEEKEEKNYNNFLKACSLERRRNKVAT
ncbi:Hypothetical protein FKW44_023953, partial [Caligus rogercresseyi]